MTEPHKYTELGKYIKQRRRALDTTVSQKHLGEILGKSQFAVSNWETGRQRPPFDIISELAAALKEDSTLNLLDLSGYLDKFPDADLSRILKDASPDIRRKILKIAKDLIEDEKN